MKSKHILRLVVNLFMVVTIITLGIAPGANTRPVKAQGETPGGEVLPAGLEEGTPFQQALKNSLAERAGQGLPAPTRVEYAVNVVASTSQHILVSGQTEIHYASPQEAGYERWPEFTIEELDVPETGDRIQVQAAPGNYNQAIIDAVAARNPAAWTEYEFGAEPRTLVVHETYEIVGEGRVEDSVAGQSSVTTDDQILFGFTYVGPDVRYTFSEEWKVFGISVARVTLQFNLDWGLGLRMPFAVGLWGDMDKVILGSDFELFSHVEPLDWDADKYEDAGVPAEDGKEFVYRFVFQFSLRIWILGSTVFNETIGPNYNQSYDFYPPFSSNEEINLPLPNIVLSPDDTGLKWSGFGIGFELAPKITSQSEITADWRAEGDATGSGNLTFINENPIPIGPIHTADVSSEDVARVRLSNFRYKLGKALLNVNCILHFDFLNLDLDTLPIKISELDLGYLLNLGTHPGTDGDVVIGIPVDIPLQVEKTASRPAVKPGEPVTFTTTVTNQGAATLTHVAASDTHCGPHNWDSLAPGEVFTFQCTVYPTADMGSFVTVTSDGDFSDTAAIYIAVLDGVVGDGTPASCTEALLDVEIFQGAFNPITFNCGPDPVSIPLTSTKVVPRTLEIRGAGLVTLDGQNQVRVFNVPASKNLTLRGLNLARGLAHNPNLNLKDTNTYERGGAIDNWGYLVLEDCFVANNTADRGGGIDNHNGSRLILRRCTFLNNRAFVDGGALFNAGHATASASVFTGNAADDKGGAIANTMKGYLVINDNTKLELNNAGSGGALANYEQARADIYVSTLTLNTAQYFGGAIANYGGGILTVDSSEFTGNQAVSVDPAMRTGGGGIYNAKEEKTGAVGQVSLRRSTLRQNVAHNGAGIHNQGDMTVDSCTFTDNFAIKDGGGVFNSGTLQVKRSTLGGFHPADGNRALGGGGLVNWSSNAQMAITSSLLQNNQAGVGGALENAPDENGNGGKVAVRNTRLLYNVALDLGGAIVNYGDSQLELYASAVSGNQAGDGGGIHNYDNGRILIAEKSSVSGNRAGQRGGGIYNNAGELVIDNSSTMYNQAGDDVPKEPKDTGRIWAGGGIFNLAGNILVTKSTISENRAGYLGAGGGIYNEYGKLDLRNTHVDKNRLGHGGLGGGIYLGEAETASPRLDMANSTINGNTIDASGKGAGVYIQNGDAWITASSISYNQSLQGDLMGGGGGFYQHYGVLDIHDSQVIGNLAESGFGGGINSYEGILVILRSRIEKNVSTGENAAGGGIYQRLWELDLIDSTVTGNTASGTLAAWGGGVYNGEGSMSIQNTDISKNHIYGVDYYLGGGIMNLSGVIYLERSSVTKNTASGQERGRGGGIYNDSGQMIITNATISGNQVENQGHGGGIYNEKGGLDINYVTIADNQAHSGGGIYGNATISASILSDNTAVEGSQNCETPPVSSGWNIENGHTCLLTGPGDLMDTDPLLNPISVCGVTRVHTLTAGSPAIDHIPGDLALPYNPSEDQCGNPRPQSPGLNRDVGAYEVPQ